MSQDAELERELDRARARACRHALALHEIQSEAGASVTTLGDAAESLRWIAQRAAEALLIDGQVSADE